MCRHGYESVFLYYPAIHPVNNISQSHLASVFSYHLIWIDIIVDIDNELLPRHMSHSIPSHFVVYSSFSTPRDLFHSQMKVRALGNQEDIWLHVSQHVSIPDRSLHAGQEEEEEEERLCITGPHGLILHLY